ncbi:hypothetical protein RYX36_007744 [Vicia faba]
MHASDNEHVDSINQDRGNNDGYATFDNVDRVELNIDLNVEPKDEPTDILVFNIYVNEMLDEINDSSKDLGNENPKNEKASIQSNRNEEDNEDDDIHIANIMKKINEEKVSQEPSLIVFKSLAKSITDKAKCKQQKVDTPRSIMKYF